MMIIYKLLLNSYFSNISEKSCFFPSIRNISNFVGQEVTNKKNINSYLLLKIIDT